MPLSGPASASQRSTQILQRPNSEVTLLLALLPRQPLARCTNTRLFLPALSTSSGRSSVPISWCVRTVQMQLNNTNLLPYRPVSARRSWSKSGTMSAQSYVTDPCPCPPPCASKEADPAEAAAQADRACLGQVCALNVYVHVVEVNTSRNATLAGKRLWTANGELIGFFRALSTS